jgi:alkylhydroperoxidase family enzyme
LLNAFQIQGPEQFSAPVLPNAPSPVPGSDEFGLGGRLPLLDLTNATPEQQALEARIRALAIQIRQQTGLELLGPDGRLVGPLNVYLYNPVAGGALFDVGNTSAASPLPARVKEVVILSVGGQWGAEYMIWSHTQVARMTRLPEEAIQSLSNGEAPVGLTGNELIAAQFVQELASTYKVSNETYHAAEAAFGQTGLVEIVNLTSMYLAVAAMLNVFEIPPTIVAPTTGP